MATQTNQIDNIIQQLKQLKTEVIKDPIENVNISINIESPEVLEETDSCPICLDNITDKNTVILRCGHKLHLTCYNQLIFSDNIHGGHCLLCPLCRGEFEFEDKVKNNMRQILSIINREEQRRMEQQRIREIRERFRPNEELNLDTDWDGDSESDNDVDNNNNIELPDILLNTLSTSLITLLRNTRHNTRNRRSDYYTTLWNRNNIARIIIRNLSENTFYSLDSIVDQLRRSNINRSRNNIITGLQRLREYDLLISGFNNEGQHGYILV